MLLSVTANFIQPKICHAKHFLVTHCNNNISHKSSLATLANNGQPINQDEKNKAKAFKLHEQLQHLFANWMDYKVSFLMSSTLFYSKVYCLLS